MKMKKKIIPLILGGIGNQLFIYSAMRRLALINHAELVLDDVSGFAYDYEYQRNYQLNHFYIPCRKATPNERLEPFSRLRRYMKYHCNQYLPFEKRNYLVQEGVDFDHRLLTYRPKNTLYIQGYWQSEDYFKDVEQTIREDLRIHPPTDSINLSMANQIKQCTSVAFHVRFFDEPDKNQGDNISTDYYQIALKKMQQYVPNAHYFLFSDHPEFARTHIFLPDNQVTLVGHNQGDAMAYADLWLMSQCQHFIIANSTFSWWGAWLSKNMEKIVITPGFEKRFGKTFWGFDGLLPKSWIKC